MVRGEVEKKMVEGWRNLGWKEKEEKKKKKKKEKGREIGIREDISLGRLSLIHI